VQQRLGPPRPLGAPQGPQAPEPVTAMLATLVAQYVIEDRIREA
jgi:hypothetical protein